MKKILLFISISCFSQIRISKDSSITMDLNTYRNVYNQLFTGDSIITNQEEIIAYKDSIIVKKDSIILNQSFLVESYKRELSYKDSTIVQLNNLMIKSAKDHKILDRRFLLGISIASLIFLIAK